MSTSELDDEETKEGQILVTTEQMSAWVKEIYHKTRGRELAGNYNYALLTELFHAQSVRWGDIARKHIQVIADLVSHFIHFSLTFVIKDVNVCQNVSRSITNTLDKQLRDALQELDKLLQDEAGHPVTYNHYYTDNIQKARLDRSKKQLRNSVKHAIHEDWGDRFHFNNSSDEIDRLVLSLQHRVIIDMAEQACSDARTDLGAYYKVAMKTFVDNVCRQVVERHILAKLAGVFDAVTVSSFTDNELIRLAAESAQISHCRTEARQLQEALEQSLRDLGN